MVLSRRLPIRIAFMALVSAIALDAQQPASPLKQTGEMRPMLYGFALGCIDCAPGEGARGRGRGGAPPVYSYYRNFPHVLAVAPMTAAEQAGIKVGDILQSIDGLSVLTDAGATRLARATAGETVRLVFERNSKPVTVSLLLGASTTRKPGAGPSHIGTGYMALQTGAPWTGQMKMEVWSDDPIVSTDSVSDSKNSGVMVLRIGTNTVIRLQLTKDTTATSRGPSARPPEDSRHP
jgi:membrane-associated protease RseP (regulator of RpoE activity)